MVKVLPKVTMPDCSRGDDPGDAISPLGRGPDPGYNGSHLKFAQILLQELLQGPRSGQRDGVSLYLHQLLFAKFCQGARERFARRAHLGGEDALGAVELHRHRFVRQRPRTVLQEPVGEARFHVLEREVIEQPDEDAQMLAHRSQHPQGQLRPAAQELDEIAFRNQQDGALHRRARIGRVAAFRSRA